MKGLRALGVRFPGPGRALAWDGRLVVWTVGRTDVFDRTSSPLGPVPKRVVEATQYSGEYCPIGGATCDQWIPTTSSR